jgi:hypothetical protein
VRITLSKSALLLSPCTAWAGEGVPLYDDSLTDNLKRDQGIEVHEAIDVYGKAGILPVHSVDPVVSKKTDHGINYLNALRVRFSAVETEVVVGLDLATGTGELFRNVRDRGYPDDKSRLYGTADVVAWGADGSVYVGDWKTGGTVGAEEQLLSLACAVRHLRLSPGKLYISCLSLTEDGCWPHEREVSDAELDAHLAALRWAMDDLGKSAPVIGAHCTALYCPHLAYCPEVAEVAEELADMDTDPKRRLTLVSDPSNEAEATETMVRLSAANRQLKYLTEAMKAYVRNGGRIISGSMEWSGGRDGFRWRKVKTDD